MADDTVDSLIIQVQDLIAKLTGAVQQERDLQRSEIESIRGNGSHQSSASASTAVGTPAEVDVVKLKAELGCLKSSNGKLMTTVTEKNTEIQGLKHLNGCLRENVQRLQRNIEAMKRDAAAETHKVKTAWAEPHGTAQSLAHQSNLVPREATTEMQRVKLWSLANDANLNRVQLMLSSASQATRDTTSLELHKIKSLKGSIPGWIKHVERCITSFRYDAAFVAGEIRKLHAANGKLNDSINRLQQQLNEAAVGATTNTLPSYTVPTGAKLDPQNSNMLTFIPARHPQSDNGFSLASRETRPLTSVASTSAEKRRPGNEDHNGPTPISTSSPMISSTSRMSAIRDPRTRSEHAVASARKRPATNEIEASAVKKVKVRNEDLAGSLSQATPIAANTAPGSVPDTSVFVPLPLSKEPAPPLHAETICHSCRQLGLACNHKAPCNNCRLSGAVCLYFPCPWGMFCRKTACNYLHGDQTDPWSSSAFEGGLAGFLEQIHVHARPKAADIRAVWHKFISRQAVVNESASQPAVVTD